MRKAIILATAVVFAACNQPTEKKMPTSDSTMVAPATVKEDGMPPGPVPNTVMPASYVKNLAAAVYAWGWPMANIHNRVEAFKDVPHPIYKGGVLPVAPPNHLCMLTDYIKPEERAVACPNQDVVYGLCVLDLAKTPVVVQVPDFGDRFWVYQICDQRTDGFAEVGKMYATKPGFYLLATTDWNGKVPEGITATFRCPTQRGIVIPRVFQSDDPADKSAIQPLINQIGVYPLADFDGKMKTTDWSKTELTPPDPAGGKGETKWVKPEIFFDQLADILKEVPAMKGEEAWYAQMQALVAAMDRDPKIREIAKNAALENDKTVMEDVFQFINVGYPVAHRWTTQRNGAQFGVDYLTRLSCARANIFVNKPKETRYFYQDLDSSGARLSGANKYTVTFAKGELPPVKGFWSLTLYNSDHFFSPNSLNRYSLGTKNKNLQTNPDGSLTLYVQNTPPAADKMNNWLPAPKETFSLYVRCYWPEDRVLNDSWTPPAVVKMK